MEKLKWTGSEIFYKILYIQITITDKEDHKIRIYYGGGDKSVGKSSASQSGEPGSNPGGGLTWVTQCMNEKGRDCQL